MYYSSLLFSSLLWSDNMSDKCPTSVRHGRRFVVRQMSDILSIRCRTIVRLLLQSPQPFRLSFERPRLGVIAVMSFKTRDLEISIFALEPAHRDQSVGESSAIHQLIEMFFRHGNSRAIRSLATGPAPKADEHSDNMLRFFSAKIRQFQNSGVLMKVGSDFYPVIHTHLRSR